MHFQRAVLERPSNGRVAGQAKHPSPQHAEIVRDLLCLARIREFVETSLELDERRLRGEALLSLLQLLLVASRSNGALNPEACRLIGAVFQIVIRATTMAATEATITSTVISRSLPSTTKRAQPRLSQRKPASGLDAAEEDTGPVERVLRRQREHRGRQ